MGWISDIGKLGETLFGSEEVENVRTFGSQSTSARADVSAVGTKQLQLDPAAIQQIIKDVLGADEGLAAIFAAENQAGIFDSSVSQQALGDLVSNIIGELAKITGREISTEDRSQEQSELIQTETASTTSKAKKGLTQVTGARDLSRIVDVSQIGATLHPEEDDIDFDRSVISSRESVFGDDESTTPDDEEDDESRSLIDEDTAEADALAAEISDLVLNSARG